MKVYFLQWKGTSYWPTDRTGLMMYNSELDQVDLTFDLNEALEWQKKSLHDGLTVVHIDLTEDAP